MYNPFKPLEHITTEVFTTLPAKFRKKSRSAWSDPNRQNAEVECFLEGPAFDREGNLWVCDIPFGRIFRITPKGDWDLVLQYDGWPNGMKFHKDGRLFICDYKEGLLTLDPKSGKLENVLRTAYSESFKGLNDLQPEERDGRSRSTGTLRQTLSRRRIMNGNEITRRAVLVALGTAPLAMMIRPRWTWADAPAGPPVARVEPVSETQWGETIVDPYRWMENPKDAEWEPFMRGQGEHARRALDSIPGRAALRERIGALSGDAAITSQVQTGGGRVFYEKRPAGADAFKIFFRNGAAGEERLLVDPSVIKEDGKHVSIAAIPASATVRAMYPKL